MQVAYVFQNSRAKMGKKIFDFVFNVTLGTLIGIIMYLISISW